MDKIGQRQDLWDSNVSLRVFSLWCEDTCRSQLPPVTNFVKGGFVVSTWCSQLDVYTSTRLDVVTVVLYSEVPDSCALFGA